MAQMVTKFAVPPEGVEVLNPCPPRTGPLDNRSKLAGVGGIMSGRKSTFDPKNPQKSVEDQFEEMAEDHELLGYTLVARVNEDVQGASEYSKRLTREKWEWVMHTIQTTPIGLVHFYALNRATRRLAIFGAFMELCRKRNVLVVLGDRIYDPRDSRDSMYLASQAARDEGMVQETREASMRGIKYSARKGKPHGVELFGYKRVYRSGGRLERIEIVRHEAHTLLEIARRVLAGESSRSIATDLNVRRSRGDIGCQKRRGGNWHPSDIRELMLNPQYRGYRRHIIKDDQFTSETLHRGMWPAIFTKATAARLDAAFMNRPKGYDTTAKTLLAGVLLCSNCPDPFGNRPNGPMYHYHQKAQNGRQAFDAYRCQNCRMQRKADRLEKYVRDVVNTWLADASKVDELSGLLEMQMNNPEIAVVKERLDAKRAELEEAYGLGLSARGLKAQEDMLLPEIDRLELDLAKMQQAQPKGNGWAAARAVGLQRLPDDTMAARMWLKRLVWVTCLPSGRGLGFKPECIRIQSR